ncbi:vWA domain-containing protein [Stieleria varia]|nr:vWA domain-containing protein [Stieleria varia]
MSFLPLAWLDWQPRVPLPLWLALAAVFTAVWIGYVIRSRGVIPTTRRPRVLAMMLVAGSIPLILLLNPTWIEPLPPPEGRPLITVLLDTSASMDVADVERNAETRFDRARSLADQIAESIDETYEKRLVTFDAQARGVDSQSVTPDELGKRSDLAAAIVMAAQTDRPRGQAVVLISDGIHNVGPSRRAVAAAQAARSRGAPVFPISIAKEVVIKNLSLESNASNRLAFVQQPVRLSAKVVSRGFDPAPVEVLLSKDDGEIESQKLILNRDDTQEVSFTVTPDTPGLYRYSVSVGGLPGEATADDNRLSVLLRVIDAPIGVLLLEGKPYWDSKFLVRNLSADPSIRLESLVMLRQDRFMHRTQSESAVDAKTEPGTEDNEPQNPGWQILPSPESVIGSTDALQRYQVIVLGRDAEAYLDEDTLSRLRNWVATQGGSLVCARGTPQSTLSEKLGRMLPVKWTHGTERRFRAQIAEDSLSEGWLSADEADPLAGMPSLATAASPETRGGLPRVLATSDDGEDSIPIVTYQPYGAGRTVVVEGAGMWRWALLPPEFAAAEQTYSSVWNGLLQWLVSRVALSPGQNRVLQSEQLRFNTDESAIATLLVRDSVAQSEMPRVELSREGDDQGTTIVCEPAGDQPGVYQARFGELRPGSYRAELLGADKNDRSVTAFEVREPITERLELSPRNDLLAAIAKQSGGQVLETADAALITQTIQQQIIDSLPVETRRTPAWDRWWVLLGVLGLWTAVWTVRRQNGLV